MSTNPMIWWYPSASGPVKSIDFGEGVTDLQEIASAEVADVYAGDGYPYRNHLGTTLRVRLLLEHFGTPGGVSLERDFYSLQAHLFKGGMIGFSRNGEKAWAGRAVPPSQDDELIYTNGNSFESWSDSTLVEGDEIVVESAHPDSFREVVLAGAQATNPPLNLILGEGLRYTYSSWVIARWRHFFPLLWLPQDQVGRPIVTGDHGLNWTLDVTLEYSVAAVLGLFVDLGLDRSSSLDLRSDTPFGGGRSIEQMLPAVTTLSYDPNNPNFNPNWWRSS